MSTTGADQYRLLALITIMAVKFQMFGGETCHVHVKVYHGGTEKTDKKPNAARARTLNRFKKIIMGHRDSLS